MNLDNKFSRDVRKQVLMAARTAAVALSVGGIAACGGGGGDTPASAVMIPPATVPKSCNNITGQLDTLQTAITGQLRPVVQGLPTVGAPAAAATTALTQALDTVDAITAALTTLASSQSAQQFTAQLTGAGDSLLCSGSSLSNSLALLATLPGGSQIPGLSQLQQTLSSVAQRVSDGLVGAAPGADLKALTDLLVVLTNQLKTVSESLPAGLNQPYLKEVLALNATALNSLALILGDLGALNGTKLAADVTGLLQAAANALPVSRAAQLGIPANVLNTVTSQFNALAQPLNNGLAAVAAPTLQAVSAVLGGVTSVGSTTAVTGTFSDLIDGALTSGGSTASLGRVTQVTSLLGSSNLLTPLLQAFGGKLPARI